ncbi:MAG: 1-acyl-sn-glycerol-3-phosphate acyltransferase, partial [Candidatus Omnitrophica bacterium]|nr:1-acyl-sn-glycerol-3-phosphate acyltransferase [Candidatus Omnitrophota bacterium]
MRILKLLYLNIIFYFLFFIFFLVAIPGFGTFIVLCAFILPRRQVLKRLRRAIVWYGTVIIRILPFPLVRVIYKNYASSQVKGPFIFVSNHRSSSDPFLMACPCLSYEAIQVVNIWPFHLPIFGILAKIAGYLSVREISFEDFLAKTTKLLKEGVSIIV